MKDTCMPTYDSAGCSLDERNIFWMVWRDGSSYTQYRHQFKKDAIAEAERLSRRSPGDTFYVLKSTAAVVCEQLPVKHLKMVRDEIPF